MSARLRARAPFAAFAALCYVPLLATSPGTVVADTKSYLYLDPARLLSRAWSMWDPHVGMGTVTHQNIGFLWPMGPWFWLFDRLGAPDWVAQRLWLGSIMLLAGFGVRYLLRTFGWRGPAVGAAMVAYACTPYLLTIAVRISAILLPFVALPWMVALAARAIRTGSWRHPAAFALIVATVGTSNATSIVLAGVGPLLWVLWALVVRERPLGAVAAAVGRIGGLTLATNAWWVVGLSVQATNGVEVLRYTESVEVTAAASSAQEVLRGLGYWFFYGDDALGPWVGPSRPYQASVWLLAVTFAVPVLALAGGAATRWRERSFAVLLAVVGLALAVGVYPYRDPSPFGAALKAFLHSDVGMAMRSMPRAAPLVVLALTILLAAGVRAVGEHRPRAQLGAAGLVVALVLLGLPPLWQRTLVPDNLSRPEDLPTSWQEAAAHLDATDDGTRVLELPGTDFTSYRWGTTIDPVTPGIMDRPMVARELVPMGSAGAWNLLKAFDTRLQAHLFESATVAPIARTMRAGALLVRSDLAFEHYDTPRPPDLWQLLLRADGLGPTTGFGAPTPNVPDPRVPMVDELTLSLDPDLPDPFPVSTFPVEGALPIVTAQPVAAPVVLAGDGDGVVDGAAAGLLDGTELLRYSASLTDAQLDGALADGAVLVVTDSNRRRAERWGTIRFTNGYTEPAGRRPLRVDRSDARLPLFPDATDDARSVALHRGGLTADATSYGGRNEYLPEDRPAHAVDGDPTTAWRTSRDDPVVGEGLQVRTDEPVTARTLTFLAAPPPINRWVTRVALRFDGGPPVEVDLDDRSHTAPGQVVDIGERTFSTLDIEVLADTAGRQGRYGGLTSTGFAEVTIGDGALRLDEAVRPPIDLLARAGAASLEHPLAVVLTRQRAAATDIERLDEEPTLVRVVALPTARQLRLAGTVRLSPRATDALLDRVLVASTTPTGVGGAPQADAGDADLARTVTATSSSRLAGTRMRASAALDGDPATAWVAAFGEQAGQWVAVDAGRPVTVDRLDLRVVADARHSVPTRVGVEVDGRRVATLDLPPVADGATLGATTAVPLVLPRPVTGTSVRLVVDEVRPLETTDWGTRKIRQLPVGIAELGAPGVSLPTPAGPFDTGCRDDLLQVDGQPLSVQVTGTVEAALAGDGLALRACGDQPLALGVGDHEVRSTHGSVTGLDVDRVVLRSAAGGGPSATTAGLLRDEASLPSSAPAPRTTVVDQGMDHVRLRVDGAVPGEPFWLAFGQSWNTGWEARLDGADLGPSQLVDGFANGWRITPDSPSFEVSLRFAPQRRVDVALWGSLVAALFCLALVLRRPRHPFVVPAPVLPLDIGDTRAPQASADVADLPDPAIGDTHAPQAGTDVADLPVLRGGDDGPPLSWVPAGAVAVAMLALGALLANPAVGVAVAVVALVAARRPVPRWVAAAVAPAAMAASGGYVVLTVWRRHTLPGLEWTSELTRAHPLAWLAVLALAADAVVVALAARRRR